MTHGFKYNTSWCVITGAPSSGKTAVIMELAHHGLAIQSEVAREIIELGLQDGQTIDDIRRDVGALQKKILEAGLGREMALNNDMTVVLDRGMPDSLTYLRLAGLDTTEAEDMCRIFRYHAIFIFDRLPLVNDDVRTENDEQADRIEKGLEEDYRSLGYSPIRVPIMTVQERTDFILKYINSAKNT